MKLYLVQHGEALAKAENTERPLSLKGHQDCVTIAAFLSSSKVRVDEVAHSGKLRAEQTAFVLAKAVCPDQAPVKLAGLGPNDNTSPVFDGAEIAGGDLMLVGHMPFMEHMLNRCLLANETGFAVNFEPGSVACLERTNDDSGENKWALSWMVRPSLLF